VARFYGSRCIIIIIVYFASAAHSLLLLLTSDADIEHFEDLTSIRIFGHFLTQTKILNCFTFTFTRQQGADWPQTCCNSVIKQVKHSSHKNKTLKLAIGLFFRQCRHDIFCSTNCGGLWLIKFRTTALTSYGARVMLCTWHTPKIADQVNSRPAVRLPDRMSKLTDAK